MHPKNPRPQISKPFVHSPRKIWEGVVECKRLEGETINPNV